MLSASPAYRLRHYITNLACLENSWQCGRCGYEHTATCVFLLPLMLRRSVVSSRTALTRTPEIYRIVSSKALDQGEGSQNVLGGERKVLEISKSADAEQKKGCC